MSKENYKRAVLRLDQINDFSIWAQNKYGYCVIENRFNDVLRLKNMKHIFVARKHGLEIGKAVSYGKDTILIKKYLLEKG